MPNKFFVLVFVVVVFVVGILLYIYNPDPTEYKKEETPNQEPQSKAEETPIFEDGTID
jgi:hypothetical protein